MGQAEEHSAGLPTDPVVFVISTYVPLLCFPAASDPSPLRTPPYFQTKPTGFHKSPAALATTAA